MGITVNGVKVAGRGTPGKDATINGVNALTIEATGGLRGTQSGAQYTLDGSALRPGCTTVTLTASGWNASAKTQTVHVPGVLDDESQQLIIPMPDMASQAAYYVAGILCTGQSMDSLTFTAKEVPAEPLTVFVTIQEVRNDF